MVKGCQSWSFRFRDQCTYDILIFNKYDKYTVTWNIMSLIIHKQMPMRQFFIADSF